MRWRTGKVTQVLVVGVSFHPCVQVVRGPSLQYPDCSPLDSIDIGSLGGSGEGTGYWHIPPQMLLATLRRYQRYADCGVSKFSLLVALRRFF